MEKIKIAQIGIGHDHAADILDCILCMPDIFEVVGLALPDEENGRFKQRVDYFYQERGVKLISVKEALEFRNLQAVTIETEEKNLTNYAQMAANKGLHIHMDKPGGFETSDFEALVFKVKAQKLVFSLGYMYRFNPYIREAIRKAKSGDIGKVYSVEAHMSCEHNEEKRKWMGNLPGGMMFFLGCHLIDLVYQIQGAPMEVVPYNASINGISEDFGMAVFRYQNGASVIKACDAEPGGFLRRQLVICGEKGTVTVNPIENYRKAVGRRNIFSNMHKVYTSDNGLDKGERSEAEAFNRYDAMMENFAKMVRGEKENEYSYEYELDLYKLVLKACGIEA